MRRVLSHPQGSSLALAAPPVGGSHHPPTCSPQQAPRVAEGPAAHPGFAAPRGPRWPLAAGLPASLPPASGLPAARAGPGRKEVAHTRPREPEAT